MDGSIRHLVYNPPTLKLLSVCRIRQSISCLGKNVERNLIEKLTASDFDDLRDSNVPISLEDMCLMERKLVLESCLRRGSWGLLEMYILLTDDIVEFDVHPIKSVWEDLDDLVTAREQFSPAIDIKLDYKEHGDFLLSLLMVKCPKLKRLTLRLLTPSPSALERFCEAMPHITKLNLSLEHHPKGYSNNNCYDGVLRAIGANMHYLKCLDISYCIVEPKAIEYLLPTEDNTLGGCPELVHLNLNGIIGVDVEWLKKIIPELPKLTYIIHKSFKDALINLAGEGLGLDTTRLTNFLMAMTQHLENLYLKR